MTFDKTFYEFRGSCGYLLARDFVNGNFSLIMTKDPVVKSENYVFTLMSNGYSVSIDMFTDVSFAVFALRMFQTSGFVCLLIDVLIPSDDQTSKGDGRPVASPSG